MRNDSDRLQWQTEKNYIIIRSTMGLDVFKPIQRPHSNMCCCASHSQLPP